MTLVVNQARRGNGSGPPPHFSPPDRSPSVSPLPANADIQLVFQTAEGRMWRGAPLHLSRHAVVWELYPADHAPRLSETLRRFQIIFQARPVYAGRAVISHLVDAGSKIICDAALDEANWTGLDFAALPLADGQVARAFQSFLGEWQKSYPVSPEFKIVVADMQTFLTDLRLWLEQVELGLRAAPAGRRDELAHTLAGELGRLTLPRLTDFFEKFEHVLGGLEPDRLPAHQTFARRQLHPLLLCAPFLHRCFTKPLGYAGDYEMVNMMLREPLEGGSLYAKIINLWFVQQPPAEAHRNRIARLVRHLQETTQRTTSRGRPARILNVGCGPAHEVQQFMQESPLADRAQFTLLDSNAETLAHCQSVLTAAARKYHRRTQLNHVKKSVQQLIREATRHREAAAVEEYDLIYCAGLFDYLSDAVGQRLTDIFYAWLAPGGRLVVTNVDDYNPRRLTMDQIMAWHLFYRRSADLLALKPAAASADGCRVHADATGVNLYFEAQKPERE